MTRGVFLVDWVMFIADVAAVLNLNSLFVFTRFLFICEF